MGGKAQCHREKNFAASHVNSKLFLPSSDDSSTSRNIVLFLRTETTTPTILREKEKEVCLKEKKIRLKYSAAQEETKRKKKRKNFDDIFRDKSLSVGPDQVRNRKKEYFEARKKRKKKAKVDDVREFPGHEDIKFGDVVQAPPKLNQKKAFTSRDASHERVRLKAVEACRNLKGWGSRPGFQY